MSDEAVEEALGSNRHIKSNTNTTTNPVPIIAVTHNYLVTNFTPIIDAIAQSAGRNGAYNRPQCVKAFIRGLGYNRILTRYDGVRRKGSNGGDEPVLR